MSFWHDPEACEAGRAIRSLGANASRIIAGLGDGITPDEASQILDGCWDMIFQVADALGDAAWASEDGEAADGLTGAQEALYAALKEMDRYVHALEARAEAVRQEEASA